MTKRSSLLTPEAYVTSLDEEGTKITQAGLQLQAPWWLSKAMSHGIDLLRRYRRRWAGICPIIHGGILARNPKKKASVSRVRGSKYRRCTEIRSKVRVIFLMKINQSAQLTKSNRSPATGRPSRLFGGEWGPKS